jgi:hypothetical protein
MVEHRLDQFFRLVPQVITIVFAPRGIAPDETLDIKIFTVDLEFPAVGILVGSDFVEGSMHTWRQQH